MARQAWLLVALLGIAARSALAQGVPAAPGVEQWCSINNRLVDAWACNLGVGTPANPRLTGCTVSRWRALVAARASQCDTPAAAALARSSGPKTYADQQILFALCRRATTGLQALPSARPSPTLQGPLYVVSGTFPVTETCGSQIARLPLVIKGTTTQLGELSVFKDYADNIYFTATLGAVNGGSTNYQWLYTEPALPGVSSNGRAFAGAVYLWDAAPAPSTPLADQAQLVDMMVSDDSAYRRWSCFTYSTATSRVCAPGNKASGTGTCTGSVSPADKSLQATAGAQLFISVEINVARQACLLGVGRAGPWLCCCNGMPLIAG